MNEIEFRKFLEKTINDLKKWYINNAEIKEFYDNVDEFIDGFLYPFINSYNSRHPHLDSEKIKIFKEVYKSMIENKN